MSAPGIRTGEPQAAEKLNVRTWLLCHRAGPLSHSLKIGLLVTNSLTSPLSENVYLSSISAVFWDMELIVGSSFLSALEKGVLLPPGLHGFRWEICCHSNECFPTANVVFSLADFKGSFFLSLYFSEFNFYASSHVFLCVYLIWDLFSFFYSVGLYLAKYGKHLAIIS